MKVKTPLKAETKERTPLTKQNLSWNDESYYSSNEIKVVKDPRSVKKKDCGLNPALLSDKSPEYRKRLREMRWQEYSKEMLKNKERN